MDDLLGLPTIKAADPGLPGTLELGAASISLTVADLVVSKEFYEKLGFVVAGGDLAASYLILKNGDAIVGLFQGMFDKNILTFNPGLTNQMERLENYSDIRVLQSRLEEAGLELTTRADPAGTGPASITLEDPDGNPILIDQFF